MARYFGTATKDTLEAGTRILYHARTEHGVVGTVNECGKNVRQGERRMTAEPFGRRSFLRVGAMGLAGTMGTGLRAQTSAGVTLPAYLADVDGDGLLGTADSDLMRGALFTSRGFAVEPNTGFDYRADVFGRAGIDQDAVDAVSRTIELQGDGTLVSDPRPITVAWHYGWYDRVRRPLLQQTVRYLGGDYLSNDPRVEEDFNRLKDEFGITVDAISWIPPRVTPTILPNYQAGYFAASNAATRHVALLYEAALALPANGGRVDFRQQEVTNLLLADFDAMAHTLVEARDRYPTRVFELAGRPVVFLFGSHSWGLHPGDTEAFDRMAVVVGEARAAFNAVYGAFPYLVGDELLPLASTASPPPDRVSRAVNFDAIYTYHAANLKTSATTFAINEAYSALQRNRLVRATTAVRSLRNRFTGDRLLIIPSLAGGFAKHGLPILSTTRQAYANYLKLLTRFYTETYLPQEWPGAVGTPTLPAPIYTVGSWNEEFEGHAVLPAEFNLALRDSQQSGFDFAMALKQVFGWNHYAKRAIVRS